jgi:hypothetical protein
VYPFVYFFEATATLFQKKDPQAAAYCKWAARSLFRQINQYNDFPNFVRPSGGDYSIMPESAASVVCLPLEHD